MDQPSAPKSHKVENLVGDAYGSLDQMIQDDDHRRGGNRRRNPIDRMVEPKNQYEIKDKIERMKGRFERFGDEYV